MQIARHEYNLQGWVLGWDLAFAATVTYCVVQILQLYGLLTYPLDERLIYGTSLCIVIPFLLEILALHYITPSRKRFWSHAGANLFHFICSVRYGELCCSTGNRDTYDS